jgi:Uma2 family endonuclease
VPASVFTLAGFREWAAESNSDERVRLTFVDGEVILDMSNEDPDTHALVKAEITRVLMNLNLELDLGRVYPDGVLLTNAQAGVSNNPDAFFISREGLAQHRVRFVPRRANQQRTREIEGTPDWVLEVLTDSSVHKDCVQLRDAYHRAGIPEYWLIDARGEELSFQILIHRKTGYVAAGSRAGWQRSRVFGRSFSGWSAATTTSASRSTPSSSEQPERLLAIFADPAVRSGCSSCAF